MRVVLDLGDEVVRDVLEISDDGSSFEDVIESLLVDAIQGRRLTEMTLGGGHKYRTGYVGVRASGS
ncbi:hypothetical protein [Aeromonas veronii]|uniref:hypothetical protein n=1 Tax=Aeromonas veronii TaxID=654 RepID=UPI0024417D36|nr:hypothetical protein [Aeromonas veronii]